MNTLKHNIIFTGIGIHSGESVEMEVLPSTNAGISFEYNSNQINVNIDNISSNNLRQTVLTNLKVTIQTPEHFLAACYALKVTNIHVKLSAPELPILDGSSMEFVEKLEPSLIPIDVKETKLVVSNTFNFKVGISNYIAIPSKNFMITGIISYPNHWIKTMTIHYRHSKEAFIHDLAPARTYGFLDEVEYLKKQGLAKGGSIDNALVITEDGTLNEPRFEDEMVRHKVLDFIGDISLSNRFIQAHIIIVCPSHESNAKFIKQLINEYN